MQTAGATGRVWPVFLFLKRNKDFDLISNLFRFLKHRMTQNIHAAKSRPWVPLGPQALPWDTRFRPPGCPGGPHRQKADLSCSPTPHSPELPAGVAPGPGPRDHDTQGQVAGGASPPAQRPGVVSACAGLPGAWSSGNLTGPAGREVRGSGSCSGPGSSAWFLLPPLWPPRAQLCLVHRGLSGPGLAHRAGEKRRSRSTKEEKGAACACRRRGDADMSPVRPAGALLRPRFTSHQLPTPGEWRSEPQKKDSL